MPRCARLAASLAAVAAFALTLPASVAVAQVQRNFPGNALRGDLQFGAPPEVLLNGQPARLAPGARIRGTNNMLAMSGALAGARGAANYTIDANGQLHDVWLLTDEEASKQPWPRTPEQAQAWTFDYIGQTWSKP